MLYCIDSKYENLIKRNKLGSAQIKNLIINDIKNIEILKLDLNKLNTNDRS